MAKVHMTKAKKPQIAKNLVGSKKANNKKVAEKAAGARKLQKAY